MHKYLSERSILPSPLKPRRIHGAPTNLVEAHLIRQHKVVLPLANETILVLPAQQDGEKSVIDEETIRQND